MRVTRIVSKTTEKLDQKHRATAPSYHDRLVLMASSMPPALQYWWPSTTPHTQRKAYKQRQVAGLYLSLSVAHRSSLLTRMAYNQCFDRTIAPSTMMTTRRIHPAYKVGIGKSKKYCAVNAYRDSRPVIILIINCRLLERPNLLMCLANGFNAICTLTE